MPDTTTWFTTEREETLHEFETVTNPVETANPEEVEP